MRPTRGEKKKLEKSRLLIKLVESDSPEVSPDDVRKIIEATIPVEVRVDEIAGGPVAAFDEEQFEVELQRGEPAFALTDDGKSLAVRLEHTLVCANNLSSPDTESSKSAQTKITVAHVVNFNCDSSVEVSIPAISAWIETNVYFIAYPYVRQFFTNITSAMGMPAVVLGYMHREERPFAK